MVSRFLGRWQADGVLHYSTSVAVLAPDDETTEEGMTCRTPPAYVPFDG